MVPATLFLLAHQDDEFGVFFEIEDTLAKGGRVICLYLTDGAARFPTRQRNQEALAVLKELGVPNENVHFLGETLEVLDGHLVEHLERVFGAIQARKPDLGPINRLVVHAWEGGHQDHDAAHLIGVALASSLDCLKASRQFTTYRAAVGMAPLFVVGWPLAANGPIETKRIPVPSRFRYLRYCLYYKTQRRTFMGLLPLMIGDYVLSGAQKLQPLDASRVSERPHAGKLLYETRSSFTFDVFRLMAMGFTAARIRSHCWDWPLVEPD
jgi:hypothetical protein